MSNVLARFRQRAPQRTVLDEFHSEPYTRINSRRLEHLASLRLPLENRSVLEIGAGVGDHSGFFVDRGCRLTITEPRDDCLATIRARFPQCATAKIDVNHPPAEFPGTFDVVYAYGVLYHLDRPAEAIEWMAGRCTGQLLLETCVSYGDELDAHLTAEDPENPSQAVNGMGCRPTRPWVAAELKRHFEHVYFTTTQPYHEQFPVDWTQRKAGELTRAVFVASRTPMENSQLVSELPMRQTRG